MAFRFLKTGQCHDVKVNVATFPRVTIPTSRHSRELQFQRCDVGANVATFPRVAQNGFCQRRNIAIQRCDIPEGYGFNFFLTLRR